MDNSTQDEAPISTSLHEVLLGGLTFVFKCVFNWCFTKIKFTEPRDVILACRPEA